MLDLMFEIPSLEQVPVVTITKEMVQKKTIIPFLRQEQPVTAVIPTALHQPEEYQHPESA